MALAQDDIRSERVQFERGAEAAIIEGSITGYERYEIPDAVEVAAAAVCASRKAGDFPG